MENETVEVFDVETTGLSKIDRIVEIGMVSLNLDLDEIDSYGKIVRPHKNSCYVPYEAFKIHGISEKQIEEEGVPWIQIAQEVANRLNRAKYHVAYNADFDIGFLKEAFNGVGIEFEPKPVIDPMRLAHRFVPSSISKRRSLAAMCSIFGVALDKAHRAVHDCRATGRVLKILSSQFKVSIDDLSTHKVTCLGSMHTNQEHLDPIEALYDGLSRKR